MKIQLQIAQVVLAFVFLVAPIARGADPALAPRNAVKLLTVGNSFADNSTQFLPELSKAGGKQLTIYRANLGGHSLGQHVSYLEAFEANAADPKGSPYGAKADPVTKTRSGGISLREALQRDTWDVVTIQQVSQLSPKYDTYQPYANKLIAYIKQYAPQAQILIQETWAYSEDCPRYKDPKLAYLKDPETMYQSLKAAYGQLSADTGLKLIPVGDAFHTIVTGSNPIRLHGLKDGIGDIHANSNGKLVGAAMFYEAIFRDSVLNVPYLPSGVTPEDAKRLLQVAHDTVTAKAAEPVSAAK